MRMRKARASSASRSGPRGLPVSAGAAMQRVVQTSSRRPDPTVSAPLDSAAVPQRRNVTVLALAQALFMSIQGMAAASNPLAGYMLLGADEKWLATAPVFLMQLGIMSATIPASLLMGVIGRRAGFVIGALLGVVGGSIGCIALYQHSFVLL